MSKILYLLKYLLLLLIICKIESKVDLCGNDGIDLSNLNHGTIWNLTQFRTDSERIDFMINVCKPFSFDVNSNYKNCDNKYICQSNSSHDNIVSYIGYEPTQVNSENGISVDFKGQVCDHNKGLNYTLNIRFTCGPHLEYPQYFFGSKCRTTLMWRTSAVCQQKPIHNEVKCYVYDENGKRRDLSPLIKPNGDYYRVLSADEEFYINVCSDASQKCSGDTAGACIRDGVNKLETVGDFRWHELKYKTKSAAVAYDHIELIYKSKSNVCNYEKSANFTSKTTIRFLCPQKLQKRSIEFIDRNPKLVSNLDCDYEIEWFTQYACPLEQIEVEANKCQLSETIHGFDFDLKSLMKKDLNEKYYQINNIKLNNSTNETFDIYFNVCGGLGTFKCGNKKWATNSVCLKSKDGKNDKVIGSTTDGKLRFADNKLLLKYMAKDTNCKFGEMSESTVIEFLCDDTKGSGIPEFVSFEDCVYYIIWKSSLICPIITTTTSCYTTHKNISFDLSLLRRGFGSNPWVATVSQVLPWSKHAKDEKDTIFIDICDVISKTPNTTSCDINSSACMTIGMSGNSSVNLGKFSSPPKFNEDINALELIYNNGFDRRTNKTIMTKITLHCKPGDLESSPVLIDFDEESGIYEFEWQTAAACPLNSVVGENCRVYDKFLDFTFDLNELKSETYYTIKTDEYEFEINVCDSVKSDKCNENTVKNAFGPYGGCQIELGNDKRAFSLGKANHSLIYWNGIINLTYTEGTAYNNKEKTPRKSHIAFICDPNVEEKGKPEFDGEKDRSYFFRWYTPLACPQMPKIVDCVWNNGSHLFDLTQLAYTQGNHFAIDDSFSPSIYYINICRPLNPIHDSNLKMCGRNSAICKVNLSGDGNVSYLSLGEANDPPISGFDGSIHLLYHNGSPCPTNSLKRISSSIKFICDPNGDLQYPKIIKSGDQETDGEECVYAFEYKTAAVCNIIEPTLQFNFCVFTDPRTNMSVDLSPLRKNSSEEPYKLSINENKSTFELNVCGTSRSFASTVCSESAVCFKTLNKTVLSYGSVTSSSFHFDGTDLRLRYSNGSKCLNSNTGKISTEIIFKCNPESKKSSPKLYSYHSCVAVFHWETHLVCELQLPECSLVSNNSLYNLRQLSSISHAWNTTDKNGNIYFLNVCAKLPLEIKCSGMNAASCLCTHYDNQLICDQHLGEPSSHELSLISNGSLLLKYKNGIENHCGKGTAAETQIIFKCGEITGSPVFIEFIKSECIYKFEWISFIACPLNNRNDVLLPLSNGILSDKRINALINIEPLLTKTFFVHEIGRQENYTYVISLSEPHFKTGKCSVAAICQTKPNDDFKRDIGSIDSINYFLRGNELQIVLMSTDNNKCGRNKNKNVTSIIRLQCSSFAGFGNPYFVYESNDCDYIFEWETEIVCPKNFVDINANKDSSSDETSKDASKGTETSNSRLWIGFFIVICVLITIALLVFYKQRTRQSVMFRFRRMFNNDESDHTFHYHQFT